MLEGKVSRAGNPCTFSHRMIFSAAADVRKPFLTMMAGGRSKYTCTPYRPGCEPCTEAIVYSLKVYLHTDIHACIQLYMRTCVHAHIHTLINPCIPAYIRSKLRDENKLSRFPVGVIRDHEDISENTETTSKSPQGLQGLISSSHTILPYLVYTPSPCIVRTAASKAFVCPA